MKRSIIIKRINEIVKAYGAFSVGEVEFANSPIYNIMGVNNQLIDYINLNNCGVTTYVNEVAIRTFKVEYTELRDETLMEILEIATEYENNK